MAELFSSELAAAHSHLDKQEALMAQYGYARPARGDALRWHAMGSPFHLSDDGCFAWGGDGTNGRPVKEWP